MNNGWIKLHRKLLDNPLIERPQWAWLWVVLLLLASHDENSFIWNGIKQPLKKGQFITGRKKLSELSGISETSIERALKYLENEHQIGQQKTTKYRLITIVKWELYQKLDNKTDNRRTTDGHIQEGKEEKEEEKSSAKAEIPLKNKDEEGMTLEEYVNSMRASNRRYIKIIGEYADEIKPNFKTKGQWKSFTNRYLRVAKQLEPFTDDQMASAMEKIGSNMKSNKNPKGFITEWDLNTLLKYVTK